MQTDWYFDFISPFSYLQWPQIRALQASITIDPRPVLFGAILDHHGGIGPAEQPAKRRFTYRMAMWQAQQAGLPMRFPPTHPFNPILALRLCLAAGNTPQAITAIFDWIWGQGRAVDSPGAIAPLAMSLGIEDLAALSADAVKKALRENFDRAIAAQVFGVPSLVANTEVFWGNDATPLFRAWLQDRALFDNAEMRRAESIPNSAPRAAAIRTGP